MVSGRCMRIASVEIEGVHHVTAHGFRMHDHTMSEVHRASPPLNRSCVCLYRLLVPPKR